MIKLSVTFPAPGDNVLQEMARLSPEIPKAIKRGLDYAMQLVIGYIQLNQLSGTGPYPPSEHRLGERTGVLRGALRATPAVIRGTDVTVEIVNPTRYAGVHEFGMTIVAKKKAMVFKIDDQLIFAKRVVIPERSPVRYGLSQTTGAISEAIMEEVSEAVDKAI